MSELIYDKTFEQALGAIKQGHKVNHQEQLRCCKNLEELLGAVADNGDGHHSLAGWAIIEKKTDKELLIEHFRKDKSSPKAWIDYDARIRITDLADEIGIHHATGECGWLGFKRLATKEEVLSLVLERDE